MIKKKLVKKIPQADQTLGSLATSKKVVRQHTPDPEEEEPEEEEEEEVASPKPMKKKGSLAAAFESVPISNNATNIPTGKLEAIIREFVIQPPDARGQSARIKYELVDPEFAKANSFANWFKLLEKDLETPCDGGMQAFKIALAKLGYEPGSLEEAEECLEEITSENPGVVIKIRYNPDYPDRPNARIEGGCDSELVEAYKDNVKY